MPDQKQGESPEQMPPDAGHKPMVLGVTGGPGSGKSTVTRMLAALGAQTADADALVRWAYNDPAFQKALARRFGAGVIDPQGCVDRKALADIVFRDEKALDDLEHLVHPAVLRQMAEMIDEYQHDRERAPMLALEIPLLYETGAEAMMDRVLVVSAPPEAMDERLKGRGWTSERIEAVLRSQWPLAEKVARADHVIDTGTSVDETAHSVDALWEMLVQAPD